jgi:hypothetical protein
LKWPRVIKNPKMVTNRTHGMKGHPLYDVYRGMIRRCYQTDHKSYRWYGGRGISVCIEWLEDRAKFFEWALNNGWKEGLQLDRRDNDGNYTPDNCRFVTAAVNSENRTSSVFRIEDAAVVKSLAMLETVPQKLIAALYQTHIMNVHQIKYGKRWPTAGQYLLYGEIA